VLRANPSYFGSAEDLIELVSSEAPNKFGGVRERQRFSWFLHIIRIRNVTPQSLAFELNQ
jgi:hypothetical protein